MSRAGAVGSLLAGVLVLLSGCFADRPRPGPMEGETGEVISVELLRPLDNAVVIAGRNLEIEAEASGTAAILTGLGYVVREVQGGQRLDSALVRFPARAVVRDTFQVLVPAQLATNTNLSIRALVIPLAGAARYSAIAQVVVAQCPPDIPACR